MTKIDINVVLNLITCIFIHIHTATAAATLHWRHLAAQRGRVAKQNKRVLMALVPRHQRLES